MNIKKKHSLGSVLGILIFILVIYFLLKDTNFVVNALKNSGPWTPIVALLLYVVLAPTPIPTDPITLILGVTYGPFIGALLATVGNVSAAVVEYYFGAKIGEKMNFESEREKLPFGLGKLKMDSYVLLIFGRMIPGYGSKVISLAAGAYKVPLSRYVWTTALTSLAGAFVISYGGFSLIHIGK